jgi:hypothetical protein
VGNDFCSTRKDFSSTGNGVCSGGFSLGWTILGESSGFLDPSKSFQPVELRILKALLAGLIFHLLLSILWFNF